MTIAKKKKRKQKPTIDTCVISHKPIKQHHIDKEKVIDWGKGRAFISAIKKSVPNPPSNPIVLRGSDIERVTLDFERWHFPVRVKIAGKEFSSLPPRIYIQNAAFKLINDTNFSFVYSGTLEETQDELIEAGTVVYMKIPSHHKIAQKPVDNI